MQAEGRAAEIRQQEQQQHLDEGCQPVENFDDRASAILGDDTR